MSYLVITPPVAEPITLADAKANMRVIGTDDDAQILGMIAAARQMLEARIGRALMPQVLEFAADAFEDGMALPRTPYFGGISIEYTDTEGAALTLDPTSYWVNLYVEPPTLHVAQGFTWPTAQGLPGSVVIRYEAGYEDAQAVPAPLKQWMLLAIGTMYENREATSSGVQVYDLPENFTKWLWHPYMVYA